jgi:predicted permease
MPRLFRKTWRALTGRERWEDDLDEELRSHVEHRAADLARGGLSLMEAERRARIELGAREAYKEECRRSYGLRWFDEAWQDLRYAVRTLLRAPGFTAVAVLSLALGIGANTAVFGVMDALVLKPLPVKDPERLAFVEPTTHSYPTYRDLRDRNVTFSGLFAYRVAPVGLGNGEATARVWGYLASGNYFDVLGVEPVIGRLFHAADDGAPGASAYAVLSYQCWRSRFNGDPTIAGRTIYLNNRPYTLLGVAPAGFHGTEQFYWPDVWVPMAMQPEIEQASWLESRGTRDCMVAGRLKDGVTPAQAEANLRAIAADLARAYPDTDSGARVRLAKLGLVGETLRRPLEAFVLGVILLSGLVLLAACANLASLVAARGADRGFELAVRVSIGAARGRIVRQLATESLALALAGGAAGCALAAAILRGLAGITSAEVPIHVDAQASGAVFLFGLGAALFSALLFGIAPVRQAFRANANGALRAGRSGMGAGHGRTWPVREILLAGQVALCCVLVTASFVAVIGARRAFEMPIGIEPHSVAVTGFDLGLAKYKESAGLAMQRRALDAASRIPGVITAAFGDAFPLGISQSKNGVYRPDETDFRGERAIMTSRFNVSPGYFAALGVRLVEGRDFSWHDDAKAPPVAVVNRTFARQVIGTEHAVGRHYLAFGSPKTQVEVIGVVDDGKYVTLAEDPKPALFRPALQQYNGTTYLFARSPRPALSVAREMEGAVRALDRNLPQASVGPLENLLDLAYLQSRAAAWCLSAFGVLAVMLAITGIYGLSAYTVSRRVREIGIRVAIGAQPGQVLRAVLGRMGTIVAVGASIGIAGGLICSTVLAHVVERAAPRDPIVLGSVAATMLLAALLSAWGPARRAIAIDPAQSLRSE